MEIAFDSTTWKAVVEWADEEIEKTRTDLETPQRDLSETEYLRGKIAALRSLKDLSVSAPEITQVDY